jgi:hypothetical protein
MSFNIILLISILLIAAVTAIGFNLTLRFVKWLASKIKKFKPVTEEHLTTDTSKVRGKTLSWLNTILVTSLSLSCLAFGIGNTLLKPDFVAGEITKLDIAKLASELVSKQGIDQLYESASQVLPSELVTRLDSIAAELPNGDLNGATSQQLYEEESIKAAVSEFEPILRTNIESAVYAFYLFLFGEETEVRIAIPLQELQASLKKNFTQVVLRSPPAELQGSSQELVETYAEELYNTQFGHVPSELALSLEATSVFAQATFTDIRLIASFIPLVRNLLLCLNLLLVAAIVVLNRNLVTTLWSLGIAFLVSGAINLFYDFIGQSVSRQAESLLVLPSINIWLIEVMADVLASIKQPNLVLCYVGGILLFFFFLSLLFGLHKPKQAKTCR